MNIERSATHKLLRPLLAALALLPLSVMADSGFYIGGGFGNAGIDTNFGDVGASSRFDEDDSAFKAFLGYRFDLPMVYLAVEGGYVDLGTPEYSEGAASASVDTTGVNLWGIAAFEAGLVDLFVKAGYVAWDAELRLDDGVNPVETLSDDGSDMGYGVGLSFGLGPVDIRGEYEKYDIEDADVSMVSIGFSFLFD